MAVYSGKTESVLIGRPLDERTYLSPSMQTADENAFDPIIYSVPSNISGADLLQPPASVVNQYASLTNDSVNSPVYNNYLIVLGGVVVTKINEGAVNKGEGYLSGLWNGFGRKDTVLSVTYSQADAIEITGVGVGDVFRPYEEKTITTTILQTAPVDIDCTITISFSSGLVVEIDFIARTTPLPLHESQPEIIEFISFLTDVIVAKNGEEQRRALRKYPRHNISTTIVSVDRTAASKRRNEALGDPANPPGTALWQMYRSADSRLTRGDTTILVDTAMATFKVGGYCVVREHGASRSEVAEIVSVLPDAIGTSEGIKNSYINAIVAPYYYMQPVTPISWSEGVNHTTFSLEYTMAEPIVVEPYTFQTEYKGIGVLPHSCTLFDGESEEKVINEYDEFDGLSGLFSKSSRFDSSKKSFKVGIHANTREECYSLRQLIYSLRGRQKTVWVPTYNEDFIPLFDDYSGLQIDVESNAYATDVFGGDAIYKHLAVYRTGLPPFYAEITDAEDVADVQTLTVDTSLSATDKDSSKICLMALCRLASDTVETEWKSPEDCYCTLEFLTVKG